MIPSVDVNYWVILVSSIASMLIGMLWYSPLLFGNVWMKLMKINPKEIEKSKTKGMGYIYLAAFISAFLMNYVLSLTIKYVGAVTALEGLQIGFLFWLGFVATVMLGSILWENKPIQLYLINVLHYLFTILIMSLILVSWL